MKKKDVYKKPNPIYYGVLKMVSCLASKFVYNLTVEKNELKGTKPCKRVIICNHESQIDFLGLYHAIPGRAHMVMSNSFLRSIKIMPIMESAGCIGKNQFQTTVADMRAMRNVLDNNGQLIFYPAGLMTEIGTPTPIPLATGKTLKWFDCDIYVAKINGTYLTSPKWATVKRRGKTTLNVYKLYDKETLANTPAEEVYNTVCSHLYFNAYETSLNNKIAYKNGNNVEGLENVLYTCPHCKEEFSIKVKNKNTLYCEKCGYEAVSNNYGTFKQSGKLPLIYQMPPDWHAFIESEVLKEVLKPNFKLETNAEVHKINDKKHCFETVGFATVTLDKENFLINGNLNGEDVNLTIWAGNFPITPFKPGKHFEIQNGKDIFRIYPENPKVVMKWIFALKNIYKISHNL
ncbi:MAG: 1-acyl-sn-glycerol-3-phosphate acyltransferase [Clostridia bacterium]|nr:1-acyl-sn-glycerol-3-phosphate acyltransferase [Clostridia bacterium]